MGLMLINQGNDLYRIKGVIAIEGEPRRFVYQAVHMIFNGDFKEEWVNVCEKGDNKKNIKIILFNRDIRIFYMNYNLIHYLIYPKLVENLL